MEICTSVHHRKMNKAYAALKVQDAAQTQSLDLGDHVLQHDVA